MQLDISEVTPFAFLRQVLMFEFVDVLAIAMEYVIAAKNISMYFFNFYPV